MKRERCIVKKCLKIWRAMVEIWKHFIFQGPSGIGKSKFAKDLAKRKINIEMVNLKILFILLQQQNMVRHMISLIQSYKAQDIYNIWWYWCNIIWISRVSNVFDRDNITKISSDIQIKHGFLIMQLLQRLHQLKLDW